MTFFRKSLGYALNVIDEYTNVNGDVYIILVVEDLIWLLRLENSDQSNEVSMFSMWCHISEISHRIIMRAAVEVRSLHVWMRRIA